MARTRAHDTAQEQRAFVAPNTQTRKTSLRGVPPQNQREAQIMASDEKRKHAAYVLSTIKETFDVIPVRSNAELAERIKAYFSFCVDRKVLPTVEGMALYVGYTRQTLNDWKLGRNRGFSDVTETGSKTSDIVKKAMEMLAAFDAQLAMDGTVNPVPYIYRSANYYGLQQRQTVSIEPPEEAMRPAMTVDEIAKNLPDPDDDLLNIE